MMDADSSHVPDRASRVFFRSGNNQGDLLKAHPGRRGGIERASMHSRSPVPFHQVKENDE